MSAAPETTPQAAKPIKARKRRRRVPGECVVCGARATKSVQLAGKKLVEACDEHGTRIENGLTIAGRVALRGAGLLWAKFQPASFKKAKSFYDWYREAEDLVRKETG